MNSGPAVDFSWPSVLNGTMRAFVVAHIEPREVARLGARILLRLHGHAEGAAELVEVVHIERAEDRSAGCWNTSGRSRPSSFALVRSSS